jgi:hypothetical protein
MKNTPTYLLFTILCLGTKFATAQIEGSETYIDPITSSSHKPIHYKDPRTITNKFELYEDSLVYFIDSAYQSNTYEERYNGNKALVRILRNALALPNSYAVEFDSFKTKINILKPSDNSFKLFNWEIINNEGLARYFAVIQKPDGKLYPLIDISEQLYKQVEDTVLKDMAWYGANYYRLMEKPTAKGIAYFLLGFNGSNVNSDIKVIDCLQFDKEGKPYFGAPMFQSMWAEQPKVCNRFFIEYQKGNAVGMNWDPEAQIIVYDHLVSSIGDKKKRNTYISDGAYDGLQWVGNGWQIVYNTIKIDDLGDGAAPVLDNIDVKKDIDFTKDTDIPGKPSKKKKKS